jgi:hypothetical protein
VILAERMRVARRLRRRALISAALTHAADLRPGDQQHRRHAGTPVSMAKITGR